MYVRLPILTNKLSMYVATYVISMHNVSLLISISQLQWHNKLTTPGYPSVDYWPAGYDFQNDL